MCNKIFSFLISFISINIISNQQKILKVLEDWNEYEISIDGLTYECPLCIPYRIKSFNGKITMSIPRIYNYKEVMKSTANVTFMSLNTNYETDHFWEAWPSEEYVFIKNQNGPIKIYSVMGYDIDSSQNYYLLDQGIIIQDNNTIMQNTSKLLIFNKKGEEQNIIYFNETDFTNSFLTDIIVDQSKEYAYITDSGNLLNNQSIPRIIVIDLENNITYKILNNNEKFKPDEDVTNIYSENEIYNYFTNITGLNNIQISCDGKILYFSSLKSKMIYKVYIDDIKKAIQNYNKTNDESYLNNIDIITVNKGMISQSFFITSKNNIYITNGENGSIKVLYSLEEDLMNYNFQDSNEIKAEKFIINWPASIDIENGKLYLLDNHYYVRNNNKSNNTFIINGDDINNDTINETVKDFVIYVADLEKGELSHKIGCSFYIFKLNIIFIVLCSLFLIILIIVIFVMFINREGHKQDKNKEKDEFNEKEDENVKELNKALNERDNSYND